MPKKHFKQPDEYWWDFEGENKVIIESTLPEHKIVKTFTYRAGFAEDAIHKAEKIIKDLEEGRTTLKKVLAS